MVTGALGGAIGGTAAAGTGAGGKGPGMGAGPATGTTPAPGVTPVESPAPMDFESGDPNELFDPPPPDPEPAKPSTPAPAKPAGPPPPDPMASESRFQAQQQAYRVCGGDSACAQQVYRDALETGKITDPNRLLPSKAGPTGHISPSDVAGKTPAQIDARARELGLTPRSPDPAGGKGAYIDEQTGQQRILSHPNASSPHAHVNNVAGQRIDIHGNVVPAESPAAHLPIKAR